MKTQLALLLQGLDANDEILGIDSAADNIAPEITRYFEKQKTTKRPAKAKVSKISPHPQQGALLEMQFVPSEGNQGRLMETQFIPFTNAVAEENPETPQLQPPTPYEIRAELEKAVLNDLLGPAGGEEEELDEDSVSDRYLVGLLAPQQRRVSPEQQEELAVAGNMKITFLK